jgi:hypothetical protein
LTKRGERFQYLQYTHSAGENEAAGYFQKMSSLAKQTVLVIGTEQVVGTKRGATTANRW